MRLTQKELNSGDHIYVRRKGFLYSHHGIYAGKGLVLHFKGAVKEKKDPAVIITGIDTFLNSGKLRRRTYKQRLPRSKTLQIARAHLSKKGYSLVFNNCEHFATYCVTGKKKSTQVHKIISSIATLTFAATCLFIQKKIRAKKKNPPASEKNA